MVALQNLLFPLSRQWVAQAESILSDPLGDPELAALLSLEALNVGYTTEADAVLLKSISRIYAEQIFMYGHANDENNMVSVAITSDGQKLIIGNGNTNSIDVYDLVSGEK